MADITIPKVRPDFVGWLTKRSECILPIGGGLVLWRAAEAEITTSHTMFWSSSPGSWLKEWRRRYFKLVGNKLYFCKDEGVRYSASLVLLES